MMAETGFTVFGSLDFVEDGGAISEPRETPFPLKALNEDFSSSYFLASSLTFAPG